MTHLRNAIPRFNGYRDAIGRFVPFTLADEVFVRAREVGARVLLRLELDREDQLCGMLYTNASGLNGNADAGEIPHDSTSIEPTPGKSPGAS